MPEAVPMFCFPHGMRLIRADRFSQPWPSASSFVFTESTGECVRVWARARVKVRVRLRVGTGVRVRLRLTLSLAPSNY